MSFLEKFSDLDANIIVMLPYRAGFWLSHADRDGGNDAQKDEMRALTRAISGRSSGNSQSEFVNEVISQTYLRKDEWPEWGAGIEGVPGECRQVAALLPEHLPDEDVRAYKLCILGIATDVAKAFREFDRQVSIPMQILTHLKIKMDQVVGAITGREYESEALLNISYQEDIALSKLSSALKIEMAPE
jgi:hypothetical protein